jgi:peptidoglycan-associated lipoprotein
MMHVTPHAMARYALCLLLVLLVAACGGRQRTEDALAGAQAALDGASDSERCAETEFRAAQRLMEQAQAAYADRDYDLARQLAEAARVQAERAREIAAANDDCDNETTVTVVEEPDLPEPDRDEPAEPWAGDYNFSTIYFGFDQSDIPSDARTTLESHARYLRDNPGVRLRLEGHCDEAGTDEYNMALGQRRAFTVRAFLIELGVDGERLSILSYGEHMPDASGNSDRNRRVVFVPR